MMNDRLKPYCVCFFCFFLDEETHAGPEQQDLPSRPGPQRAVRPGDMFLSPSPPSPLPPVSLSPRLLLLLTLLPLTMCPPPSPYPLPPVCINQRSFLPASFLSDFCTVSDCDDKRILMDLCMRPSGRCDVHIDAFYTLI